MSEYPFRGSIKPEKAEDAMLAYHVTNIDNLPSIMANGLVPAIGPRSELLGENAPAVYCFPDIAAMDNALLNWLGQQFDEEDEEAGVESHHVALEVILDDELVVHDGEFYEIAYPAVIPPSCISILEGYEVD